MYRTYKYVFGTLLSILLDMYPEVELLDQMCFGEKPVFLLGKAQFFLLCFSFTSHTEHFWHFWSPNVRFFCFFQMWGFSPQYQAILCDTIWVSYYLTQFWLNSVRSHRLGVQSLNTAPTHFRYVTRSRSPASVWLDHKLEVPKTPPSGVIIYSSG